MAGSTFNKMKTPMRYNRLGAAGVQVSELSFGCMTFSDLGGGLAAGNTSGEAAFDLMRACFEHGINFFDNAEAYGGAGASERIMGEAVRTGIERGVWERKDLVISTKLYIGSVLNRGRSKNPNIMGLSRKHLTEGLIESLARMKLDYVDLLFCHRPDPAVRIEETVRTMNDLIRRGLCFYWGTSEWSAQQLQEARGVAERLGLEPPLFDQCQYSLIERKRVEREYAPLYPDLGLTIWSPLAGGLLTGKYKRGQAAPKGSRYGAMQRLAQSGSKAARARGQQMLARFESSLDVAERVAPIAAELGCSLGQLALAWAAANPRVSTVILGATSMEQLKENLGALPIIAKLTPEVMARVDKAAGTAPAWDAITQQVSSRVSKM